MPPASAIPTTVQRSPPNGSSAPSATPLNRSAMFLPTTISCVPNWKARPSVTRKPGRSSNAWGDTPRTTTLLIPFVVFLKRLITTTTSRDSSGRPSLAGATSGWVSRTLAVPRSIWLTSSEPAARRSTMAFSGEPVSTSVASRPWASIKTPANTNTTSATPPRVRAVVRRRAQRLRQM